MKDKVPISDGVPEVFSTVTDKEGKTHKLHVFHSVPHECPTA